MPDLWRNFGQLRLAGLSPAFGAMSSPVETWRTCTSSPRLTRTWSASSHSTLQQIFDLLRDLHLTQRPIAPDWRRSMQGGAAPLGFSPKIVIVLDRRSFVAHLPDVPFRAEAFHSLKQAAAIRDVLPRKPYRRPVAKPTKVLSRIRAMRLATAGLRRHQRQARPGQRTGRAESARPAASAPDPPPAPRPSRSASPAPSPGTSGRSSPDRDRCAD